MFRPAFIFGVILAFAGGNAAGQIKCTAPDGTIKYQDRPCAAHEQEKQFSPPPRPKPPRQATPESQRIEPNPSLDGPIEAREIIAIYRRWIDAEKLAGATARVALAGPVATLQDIARTAERVTGPECIRQAADNLRALTKASVDSYVSFMLRSEIASFLYQGFDRGTLIDNLEHSVRLAYCKKPGT